MLLQELRRLGLLHQDALPTCIISGKGENKEEKKRKKKEKENKLIE